MSEPLEGRVEELEVKAAYLEHQLGELDLLVRELFAANADLKRELSVFREARTTGDDGSLTFSDGAERPPHY